MYNNIIIITKSTYIICNDPTHERLRIISYGLIFLELCVYCAAVNQSWLFGCFHTQSSEGKSCLPQKSYFIKVTRI